MIFKVKAVFDGKGLAAIKPKRMKKGISRTMRRASSTSLRDMRSEASKRVRARKRIKAKVARQAIEPRKNAGRTIGAMMWGVDVRGDTTRLSDYPHRQTKKGVSVSINRGKLTKISGGFVATMRNGHKGVFVRKSSKSLPIIEPLASRAVDALLHKGEAEGVSDRGRASFVKTVERLMAAELDKSS